MKSDLAIAALIRSRMAELGLSRGEFAKRLGYKNIAKGIRRIAVLCDGDLEGTKRFLDVLPQALETSADTVKLALEQTVRELELAEKQEAEARDKIWRENFRPHGIILTEKTVPSPIFVAGRSPRVWQTYWVRHQLLPRQGGQVRFKWPPDRNSG